MKKITLLLALFLAAATSYAQFPAPYCGPVLFANGVEPITLVNFAGINNASSAVAGTDGENIPHEDYTAVTGAVVAGSTYTITLKGNTAGNFTNRFNVYVDWNQDGDFADAGEAYAITNVIYGSTGLDAIETTQVLLVPGDALAGSTRMRVKKTFGNTLYPDPCVSGGTGYGQIEDYTINVTLPACISPSAGMATVLTETSADLSWTSPGTNAEIVVQLATEGAPGDADDTGVEVQSNTYSATDLTPNTQYEFYVRNECEDGTSFSTWAGPYAFITTVVPGCATPPILPANGAIDVPVGNVTFSWSAPTTGGTAVSYDLYYGLAPGEATIFIQNYTTLTAAITLTGYSTDFYWKIVPKNAGGSAIGCEEWSFTTVAAPPAPANDACSTAIAITSFPYTNTQDATSATNNDGFISVCGGTNDGVWYTVVGNGVNLTVALTGVGGWDAEIAVYRGSCGTFTCVGSIDNGGSGGNETYVIANSILGTTYYINVGYYSGVTNAAEGPFTITVTSAPLDTPDYVSLQSPITQTTLQGTPITVYGQVYEAGLTDVAPTSSQAAGIEAWVGVSATNSNPNTWATASWTVGTYNAAHVSNNDEYSANVGGALAPGTYYYATRFRLNNGPFVYGGVDAAGNGNFWNGTTHLSGVLTVTPPPPPANDACSAPTVLTVGGNFALASVNTTNIGGSNDVAVDGLPTCGGLNFGTTGKDVWFTAAVPASGSLTFETGAATPGLTDTIMQVFSGSCGALVAVTPVGCHDDITSGSNLFSRIAVTGRTPGEILTARVWGYNGTAGAFKIAAYDASLGNAAFDNGSFSYYPNPVKNVLNLSYADNISKVAVYNLLGQQVIAKTINANQSQVDMSELAAGTYVVKVTANNQVKTIKVIKE